MEGSTLEAGPKPPTHSVALATPSHMVSIIGLGPPGFAERMSYASPVTEEAVVPKRQEGWIGRPRERPSPTAKDAALEA